MPPPAPESPARPGRFATTQWTQVLAARGDSEEARNALSELCGHYYEPVLAYLRRAGGDHAGEARDLAHDFFAQLLEGGSLEGLQRGQGHFRSYLLGAVKHFLSHQRVRERARKRGGGLAALSINETGFEVREGGALADDKNLPPDAWFDQQWAVTLLARALETLEEECRSEGQAGLFEALRPWLTGEAAHGEQAALAGRLGLAPGTLKSAIHRLRRRFRHAVKAEIGRTLGDGADPEAEMAALFAALGGPHSGARD